MEVSALRYSSGGGLQGHTALLKLQPDERLVALIRRGNVAAFEVLVSRYEVRLLAFCRHLLNSREDAEDVLQEVLAASYNAMRADERPINVRPWLYRIARNRCLNHLRKATAVGVDSMDVHFADYGASTADKVHEREEFRQLVDDIGQLPETQRTALVLREMDALSYEQIAEAMDTTVSSVKSLLVRARVSLAEAAEARILTCEEVRQELGEVAEGLLARISPPVRRHMKACPRCDAFHAQLKSNNKALAALAPLGLLAGLRHLILAHLGHSAGSGVGAATGAGGTAGAGAAGAGAAGAGAAAASGGGIGFVGAGMGALATKAVAVVAAAAIVTAGTVAATHSHSSRGSAASAAQMAHSLNSASAKAAGATKIAAPVKKTSHSSKGAGHHSIVAPVKHTATTTTPVAAPPVTTTPVTTTTTTPTGTSTTPTTTSTQTTTLPTVSAPPPTTTNPTATGAGGQTQANSADDNEGILQGVLGAASATH